ncbi:MAG: YgiQ family radical SAM protein [Clostridia bacterium]|nr:YgiQ family radical SAM protein [Clostridia bacterium]
MFLPVSWQETDCALDFVMISSDAYVDHPTFGHALIARLFESYGYKVGIIPQPITDDDYRALPVPMQAYIVVSGVVDSMVNNYTVAKNKRKFDVYSPPSKQGKRPDRQVIVYTRALKRLFPEVPVIIGGIEASLRRFAHYDYWADKVMKSVLVDSGADLLIYGMGEKPVEDICSRLDRKIPLKKMRDIRGTCVLTDEEGALRAVEKGGVMLPDFSEVSTDKASYARAFKEQSRNTDALNADVLIQGQGDGIFVIQNKPAFPLTEEEMDRVFALPYERTWHPMYDKDGGIKAIEEVKFSVVSHRGCYGSCSFCAINYHQGRRVQKRSDKSILGEIEALTKEPDFKGYINDLSGPSANFREPACEKQKKFGVCKDRYCIGFTPCKNLKVDHTGFLSLLEKARGIKGVKKIFIRSGIRYDYILYDEKSPVLEVLCAHHISGQLKVAPEHMSDRVLKAMNKPSFEVYKKFAEKYRQINLKMGKKQFLVPYLISSHPECRVEDAVKLTEYLKSIHYMPEQVQDFYPTPSTRATCMYYTGIDPDTMKEVFVPKTPYEKKMQRALLQYRLPANAELVKRAYAECGLNAYPNKKPPFSAKGAKGEAHGGKKGKNLPKKQQNTQNIFAKNKKYGKIK